MKAPADGWDPDERDALRGLESELEEVRRRHESDPPIQLLRAGRHEALPADLQEDVADFTAASPWNRAILDGIDAGDEHDVLAPEDEDRLLARIRKDATADVRPATWRWLRPAVATAAVALIAVSVWIARKPSTTTPAATSTESRQTAAPAPAREFQLPLEQPEMMLSTAALTWRGSAAENPFLTALKPAVDAFRTGDYAGADREFSALESRYPSAIEVFYYGGVARLFLGENARAMVSLDKASTFADTTFAPHVEWYRAVAEQRAGRPSEARARLEALCRGTSTRAAAACSALKQLP